MFVAVVCCIASGNGGGPTIDPANPAYLRFRNRTTALISNTEHYGALLNIDFDYRTYLKALAEDGFTLTQTFAGSYVEPDSDCGADNPLSPRNGSYISPWKRSGIGGNSKGGTLWDLTAYNATYFARLVDYTKAAEELGIVVDFTLFCGYELSHDFIWDGCPLNPKNTVNGGILAGVRRDNVFSTATAPAMLQIQKDMVEKVATALKPFTNVIYHIVFTAAGGATPAWGEEMIAVLQRVDPGRLITAPSTWNVEGESGGMPGVTLPNYDFGSAMTTTAPHRNLSEACSVGGGGGGTAAPRTPRASYWCYLLEGGTTVLNLDWSYAVHHEDGSLVDVQTHATPSGPYYRKALQVLSSVVKRLDLVNMAPMPTQTWSVVLPQAASPAAASHGATANHSAVHSLGPRHRQEQEQGRGRGRGQGNQFVFFVAGINMVAVEARLGSYVPATVDVWECVLELIAPQNGDVLASRTVQLLRSPTALTTITLPPTYKDDVAGVLTCDQE